MSIDATVLGLSCVSYGPQLEDAMHLIDQKPEEKQKMDNAFEGIKEVPRWHWWLEVAIRLAAILTIIDFLFRYLLG
jgi:hypothetical protein